MCIKENLMRIQSSQVMKNHNQIMDYITEMIVSFDFFGELLYANPPFMKTLGYDETEDREINLWSLLKEEDKKLWDRFFLFAKEGKEIENKEVTLVSKEGNVFRIFCKNSPRLKGELLPYSANVMIAKWDDRSYDADAFVNFQLDENGKAEGMKLKPISDVTDFSFDFQDLDLKRIK